MDFVKGKSQNRVTAEKMACYKILKVKLTENTTFNSLLHQNWKKKKKTTSGGSEKQSWKCKRAAALVMTRYES